tara:strand:+ start:1454 stop:2248 length:795 start_codon:yes stop_codon:yes gene_type:complete
MGLRLGIIASSRTASGGGGGVDADAQAFFDRVTAAGGTTSGTEQTAVNTLTLSFKSTGIWSKMRVIYPMVGASAASCSQNLKSSSFTGTISGCTFSSNGVVYGNLGEIMVPLNLNTMNSINDISFGYYCRNDISSGGSFGWGVPSSYSPVVEFWIEYPDGNRYGYLFDNANDGGVAGNSSGLNSISRIGSTTKYIQKNSSINTYTGSSSGSLPSRNFYFGRGGQGYEQGRENAFGFIADGLTSTNLTDLYTAVQAFQTTLLRQV